METEENKDKRIQNGITENQDGQEDYKEEQDTMGVSTILGTNLISR